MRRLRINTNAIRNKIQHYRMRFEELRQKWQSQEQDLKEENDKIDEASKQSFPASDPPAYLAKFPQDEHVHRAP